VDDTMFSVIVDSLQKGYTKKSEDTDDDIIVDLSLFLLILDGNNISNGEVLGNLLNFSKAKKADLTANKLGQEGAKQLAEKLKSNKSLEELIVAINNIGCDGFVALMDAIKGNKSFKSFNFSSNGLNESVQTYLADAIKENSGLVALDLADNPLGDQCIATIFQSLNNNQSMEYLNLTKTELTSYSGQFLGPFFKAHSHITGFKVGYNKLNPQCGVQLGHVMQGNNVVILDVRFSNIGENGTCGIFAGLLGNKSIMELVVSGNPINKKGLGILAKVLTGNTTLQKLGMRFCDINKSGFLALAKVIETNTGLTYLDLSHNVLDSSEACKRLAEALGHEKK